MTKEWNKWNKEFSKIRITKPKVGPLKRSSKLPKLWLRWPRKHKEDSITKINNRRGGITTEIAEIKRIIKKYYEQIYTNILDNLDNMGNFRKIKPPQTELKSRPMRWIDN